MFNSLYHSIKVFNSSISRRDSVGETGAMSDTFWFFPLSNVFKDDLRKNKSIEVFSCPLFMFIIYFIFFRKTV